MGQAYAILKYIRNEIEITYDFLWNGKKMTSQEPSSASFEGMD